MLRHLVAVAVIVGTVVAVTDAEAADPTAQRFVDAVALGSIAVDAKRAEIRTSLEAFEAERCRKALDIRRMPQDAVDDAMTLAIGGLTQYAFAPVVPELRGLVAAMDAVPTTDPVLRSGRAAWRVSVAGIAGLDLDRPCRQLEAWGRAGWKRDAPAAVEARRFARRFDRLTSSALERKFDAAERRLRKLGVSAAEAELWTGEGAFKAVEKELERSFDSLLDLPVEGDEPL
jgi:hypothetical protein